MPRSLVDVLWGLDLLAGRAQAVGAEFLLSGPVNHWLRRLRGPPPARYVLLTTRYYEEALVKAMSVGFRPLEGPSDMPGLVSGVALHGLVRGLEVTILTDPVVRAGGGEHVIDVEAESRWADTVIVGSRVVRLAPLGVEAALWGW